ncbi:MAG: PilT/PilU family type 4a pilus ATPase [Myxococcota bacterium]|nr:PilT/PilU family type 4a pilus ATPase [Myxococcota bacterium]
MKTLQELLRELARTDVTEVALASDRLPCAKTGSTYEPLDRAALSTEAILEMLAAAGGGRYVEELAAKSTQWTARIEGVGTVGIHAAMREGRVRARFELLGRPSIPGGAPVMATSGPPPVSRSPRPPPAPRSMRPPSAPTSGAVPLIATTQPTRVRVSSKPPRLRSVRPASVESDETVRRPVVTSVVGATEVSRPSPLDALLALAREERASDLHLVAERPMLLRLAGHLVPRGDVIDETAMHALVDGIVPDRLQTVLAEQGSCDFALQRGSGENAQRYRVNVARQRTGLKACFRCIALELPTLASLGLPAEIERATHHHQGLVLVTGPTGQGKTSTLAAIVDIINRDTTHHVITVEDPVEYIHPRKKAMISQREVGSHTRAFQTALKASLREDPDVVVVGELRDTETVRMALAASETGHLVLATMNTPSAAKTIDRLIDLFPPPDQQQVRMTLAGGLHLVIGQRLLPAADRPGSVAAVELLPGSVALWSMIRDNKTYQVPSLQQRGKGFGIIRIDDSLTDLVRAGRVMREAALAVAEAPDELDAILSGKRSPLGAAPAPEKPPPGTGILGKVNIFGKRGA